MSGATRANAVGGLVSGKFDRDLQGRVRSFSDRQILFKGRFWTYASDEERSFYQATLSGSEVERTESLTKAIAESQDETNFSGKITPQEWIAITSNRIASLTKVKTKVRDDFINNAQSYVDDTDNAILSFLAVSVIFVSVSLIIAFFVGAILNRPLTSITKSMKLLASRNLETVIFYTGNPDEIGQMARAVAVFKTNAIENARLRAEQEEQKARAAEEQKQALNRMADSFKARVMDVVKTVAASSTELQSTAQAMSAAATQSTAQATTVAAAAEQTSANVQTVATATEELSASIAEITRQVTEGAATSEIIRNVQEAASGTREALRQHHRHLTRRGRSHHLLRAGFDGIQRTGPQCRDVGRRGQTVSRGRVEGMADMRSTHSRPPIVRDDFPPGASMTLPRWDFRV